jgi:hypothetical protein
VPASDASASDAAASSDDDGDGGGGGRGGDGAAAAPDGDFSTGVGRRRRAYFWGTEGKLLLVRGSSGAQAAGYTLNRETGRPGGSRLAPRPAPARPARPAPRPQGFTATAFRRSARESRELLRLYGEPVFATSINTMVQGGFLCDVSGPWVGRKEEGAPRGATLSAPLHATPLDPPSRCRSAHLGQTPSPPRPTPPRPAPPRPAPPLGHQRARRHPGGHQPRRRRRRRRLQGGGAQQPGQQVGQRGEGLVAASRWSGAEGLEGAGAAPVQKRLARALAPVPVLPPPPPLDSPGRNALVAETWQRLAGLGGSMAGPGGRARKTLVFAADINHGRALLAAFRERGETACWTILIGQGRRLVDGLWKALRAGWRPALKCCPPPALTSNHSLSTSAAARPPGVAGVDCIDGTTLPRRRAEILDGFRRGAFGVLINVMVGRPWGICLGSGLGAGWRLRRLDLALPSRVATVWLRPTSSRRENAQPGRTPRPPSTPKPAPRCPPKILTEGFDLPNVDAVFMARPTRSTSLYCQARREGGREAGGRSACGAAGPRGRRAPAALRPAAQPPGPALDNALPRFPCFPARRWSAAGCASTSTRARRGASWWTLQTPAPASTTSARWGGGGGSRLLARGWWQRVGKAFGRFQSSAPRY